MRATEMLDYLTTDKLTAERKSLYTHFDCDPEDEDDLKELRETRREYRKQLEEPLCLF